MKHDAFISYSHSDCGTIAPAIQKAIENIGKPWYQLKRNLNVFRDETNLGANPHLWENIEKALDDSKNFILLASPKACESDWITKEIEKWAEKDPSLQKFNIVVTSGEIYWDKNTNDFNWEKTTCLPKCLKDKFQSEPLYIDLKDYINKNNRPIDYKSSGFTYKIVKIIAAITGLLPREIESDEKKRRNKTIFALTIGAIIFVFVSLLTFMINKQKEINERNAIANNLIAEGNKFRETNINKALLCYTYAYEKNNDYTTLKILKDFYSENNIISESRFSFGNSIIEQNIPSMDTLNLFFSESNNTMGSKKLKSKYNTNVFELFDCKLKGRLLNFFKQDKTILTTVYLNEKFKNIYENETKPTINNFILSTNNLYAFITLRYSHFLHSFVIDIQNSKIIKVFDEESTKYETGFKINPSVVYFDTEDEYYLVGYENGSFQKIFFHQYDSEFKIYNYLDLNSKDNYTSSVTALCSSFTFIFVGYEDGTVAIYENNGTRYTARSNGGFIELIKRIQIGSLIQQIYFDNQINTVFIESYNGWIYKMKLNKNLDIQNITSKKIIKEFGIEDLSEFEKDSLKISQKDNSIFTKIQKLLTQ